MTTFVKWSKAYDVGKEHGLRVGKYKYQGVLYASSFENGTVTIEPGPGAEISWFCNIIVGCFEGYSNFRNEIVRAFNLEQKLMELNVYLMTWLFA